MITELLILGGLCAMKKRKPSISGIEKAYITSRGTISDPKECADWMYKFIKRKFGTTQTDIKETREVVAAFAKRYECSMFDAERIIAGLAYYGEVTRKYDFAFYRNFGQYYIQIDKKRKERFGYVGIIM